jgi:hypothetical protein
MGKWGNGERRVRVFVESDRGQKHHDFENIDSEADDSVLNGRNKW